jgi:hypothetical protein
MQNPSSILLAYIHFAGAQEIAARGTGKNNVISIDVFYKENTAGLTALNRVKQAVTEEWDPFHLIPLFFNDFYKTYTRAVFKLKFLGQFPLLIIFFPFQL